MSEAARDEASVRSPLTDILENRAGGDFSPIDFVGRSLVLAEAHRDLNCFIELFNDLSDRSAGSSGSSTSDSSPQPLAGIPFAVKDIFQIGSRSPTAGAKLQGGFSGIGPSPLLQRLGKLGAVLVGVTNLDEVCYGMTGLNAHFGAVSNPRNRSRIAGGSSSGSAAAVAAGIVPFALGSDTGGSIRVPAALCGIVGFKPTLGRLTVSGAVPLSQTQDCIGLLARSVEDVRLLMSLLERSVRPTSVHPPLTIGICRHRFFETDDKQLDEALLEAQDALVAAGHAVVEIDANFLEACDSDAATITGYEAVRYHAGHIATQIERFSESTRVRFERARHISDVDYSGARERHAAHLSQSSWWAKCDLLLAPTVTTEAPYIGDLEGDSSRATEFTLSALRCTRGFSFLGGPAISVPTFRADGSIWGLQIVGRPGQDANVLDIAGALEQIRWTGRA